MRSFFSACLTIAAVILAAVAGPQLWVHQNVANQKGFVDLVGPVGSDPSFQRTLADATAKAVSSQLQSLPLPQSIVQPLFNKATSEITSDPGFPQAWSETLQRSQELTIVDPRANANDSGVLNLDVQPLMRLVVNKVAGNFASSIQLPDQILIAVGSQAQRSTIVDAVDISQSGTWVAAGAVIALALALLVARRRSTVLIGAGVGALIVAAAWWLGLVLIQIAADRTGSSSQIAKVFEQKFLSVAVSDFTQWVLIAAAVGLVLIVVGIITKVVVRSRQGTRRISV